MRQAVLRLSCVLAFLVLSAAAATAETFTGSWYLSFPLAGYDSTTPALVNTVFDHTGGAYEKDHSIVAFTGETGNTGCFNSPQELCKQASGQDFSVRGTYSSRSFKNGRQYLSYSGHRGYDYAAAMGTSLYAPADGVLTVPTSDSINGDPTKYNTFYIDHGNGYSTWFLHASTHIAPGAVKRGDYIGQTGDTGAPGAPHLHFEVRRNGIPVDPYGWDPDTCQGDPYTAAPSVNVWTKSGTEWAFSIAGNTRGWVPTGTDCSSVRLGRLWLNPSAVTPLLESPPLVNVSATQFNSVDFRMVSGAPDGNGAIYFITAESPSWGEDKVVPFTAVNNGTATTYQIAMSVHPLWRGTIKAIRIRPSSAGRTGTDSDSIGFDYIRLTQTAQALPVVTASVSLTPATPYYVGQTLTARFTIANRGTGTLTIDTLTAGGRRSDDPSCSAGCPDFSPVRNLTLGPGQSYAYSGTQTMTAAGTYNAFVAYRRPDGSWNTSIPADPGVANSINFVVSVPALQTDCGDAARMSATVTRRLQLLMSSPPPQYLPATSIVAALVSLRLQAYDELYYTALDLRGMATTSLGMASRSLAQGDLPTACKYLQQSERYMSLMASTEGAAADVWLVRVNNVREIARLIASKCCELDADLIELHKGFGPKAGVLADLVCVRVDYALDSYMYGKDQALRNVQSRMRTEVLAKVLLKTIPVTALGGKTVNEYIENGVFHEVGASRLYSALGEIVKNPSTKVLIMQALANLGEQAVNGRIEAIATEYLKVLQDTLNTSLLKSTGARFAAAPDATGSHPYVIGTSPAVSAAYVSAASPTLTATFDQNIVPATLDVAVTDANGASVGIASRNVSGSVLTFTLASPLARAAAYTVSVRAGAVNSTGGVPNEAYQWSFATAPRPFGIGDTVTVANTGGAGLNLRSTPAYLADGSNIVRTLPEGMRMQIVDGPVQADGYSWWRTSANGWCAIGDWLAAGDGLGLRIGASVSVANTSGLGLRLRTEPGLSATLITTMPEGTSMTVLSGPYYVDGYLWWNLKGASGTGYSAVAPWMFPDAGATSTGLTISAAEPASLQSRDWSGTVTYSLTVTDSHGAPVPGATVAGQDDVRGVVFTTDPATTNGSGVVTYTTTVPFGKSNGSYSIAFVASKSGLANSPGVVRQVRVDHDCNYSLDVPVKSFPAAGGNASLNVTAGASCGWTATTTDPWIVINGTNGVSPLAYTIGTNPTTNPRTGTIVVQGSSTTLTLTIQQDPQPPALPTIVLPSRSINAGTALVGSTAYQSVVVQNTGAGTLIVSDVRRTSGSADFQPVVSIATIPPGGSGSVTVQFTPSSAGGKSATFTVISNDPVNGSITFDVSGAGTTQSTGGIDFVWNNQSTTPERMTDSASATIGSAIYVLGAASYKANYKYDPTINTWSPIADAPYGVLGGGAAALNGKVYLYDQSNHAMQIYDPATNGWTTGTPSPNVRDYFSIAAANGKIYVIGGRLNGATVTSLVEEYDPSTDSWRTRASMPTARQGAAAAVVNNVIYVVGGAMEQGIMSLATEAYDPAANTWTTRETALARRYLATATVLNNKIYVIGGYDNGTATTSARVDEFDPSKSDGQFFPNAWASRNPLLAARYLAVSGTVNGYVYVIGGTNSTNPVTAVERGALNASPIINVPVKSASFGDVALGRIGEVSLTVQNVGNASLTLSVYRSAGSAEITPFRSASPLDGGQSSTFVFRFAPTSAGSKSATIRIDSNDPATPSVDLTLTGNAVTAPPDAGTWQTSRTIPVSGSSAVNRLAISNGRAFVTRSGGTAGAALTVLDLTSGSTVADIPLVTPTLYASAFPGDVATQGGRTYVALYNLGANGQLAVVDPDAGTVSSYVAAGTDPLGVAVTGNSVYVTNSVNWSNGDPATVRVIDTTSNTVVKTLSVGRGATDVVWDPATSRAYVANLCTSGCSAAIDPMRSVSVIDTKTNAVVATIPLKNGPNAVAIAHGRVYACTDSSVEVIDQTTNAVVASIPIPTSSYGIAATADYVFVPSGNSVIVISVAMNAIVAKLDFTDPRSIAVDPNTNLVYVLSGQKTITELRFVTPRFSVACDRQLLATLAGSSAAAQCTVTALDGFSASVNVGCSGLPAGVTCQQTAAPAIRTLAVGAAADTGLSIGVAPNVAAGSYGFRVTGSSGAQAAFSELTLAVGTCNYSLASREELFASTGGSATAQVFATSGCAWSAASNASWIALSAGANGTGDGTFAYSVQPNPSANARAGTITIGGQTLTVTQAGETCSFVLPAGAGSAVSGSSGSFSLTASRSDCRWVATADTVWLKITSAGSGSGNTTIDYSVDVNSGGPRSASIRIADQKFTITQPGPPVRADIDTDRKTDVSIFRPLAGDWFFRRSTTGQTVYIPNWGPQANDIPVPGDYDGDGITDAAVFRPGEGNWYIRQSSTGTLLLIAQWGLGANDKPVPADYDGDGKTDAAIFRPGTGEWFIRQSSNGQMLYVPNYGPLAGDIPVPGDYDGDGKADIAIFRPIQGNWYIRQSSTGATVFVPNFGPQQNDRPVPADYDGDGKTDIAIFRPLAGDWFIRRSSDGGVTYVPNYGPASGDVPVPADYDGDGRADIAIFRPGLGNWYVLQSSTNTTILIPNYGPQANDKPLPAYQY